MSERSLKSALRSPCVSPSAVKKSVKFGDTSWIQSTPVMDTSGGGNLKKKKMKKKAVKLRFIIKSCKGDPKEIIHALEAKADPNEADSMGTTVLSQAMSRDYPEVVKVLLEHKADANKADEGGWTPLLETVGRPKMHHLIQYFLSRSGDVNATTQIRNWSPLHLFARSGGSVEHLRLLLEAKGDLNARDAEGITPLSAACGISNEKDSAKKVENQGHSKASVDEMEDPDPSYTQITKTLLEYQADISPVDKIQWTCLHHAAFANKWGSMREIIKKGGELFPQDARGRTPLHLAAQQSNYESCALLLSMYNGSKREKEEYETQPWKADIEGRTALHMAAEYHASADVVKLLLSHRCPVDREDYHDATALHKVAGGNDQIGGSDRDVTQILLSGKANALSKDSNGNTPLHLAAISGRSEVVECILRNSDKPQKLTRSVRENGETPLHCAVSSIQRNASKIVGLLLEARADPEATNYKVKESPYARSSRAGKASIRALLEISRYPTLLKAVAGNDARRLFQLLSSPKHLESIVDLPESPLNVAVRHKADQCLSTLLKESHKFPAQAQKVIKAGLEDTSLLVQAIRILPKTCDHYPYSNEAKASAKYPHINAAIVRSLVEARALVNVRTDWKSRSGGCVENTVPEAVASTKRAAHPPPLVAAAGLDWAEGRAEIIRILMHARADPEACLEDGWTALHEAAHSHKPSVLSLIFQLSREQELDIPSRPLVTMMTPSSQKSSRSDVDMASPKSHTTVTTLGSMMSMSTISSGTPSNPHIMSSGTPSIAHIPRHSTSNLALRRNFKRLPTLQTSSISSIVPPALSSAATLSAPASLRHINLKHLANAKDHKGNTPLHAVLTGDVAESDSDSEEEEYEPGGEESGTNLNIDANGLRRCVEILLAEGADPRLKNRDGQTALELAKAKGLRKYYKLMKRHLKGIKECPGGNE